MEGCSSDNTYRSCLLWNTDVSSSCTFSLKIFAPPLFAAGAFGDSCGRYCRVREEVRCEKEAWW